MTVRPEVEAGVAGVDLAGKTVLVTGSTDGIGRETALALGRLGATVLVHGRDRTKGEAVVDALASTAGDGDCFVADFADRDAVEDLVAGVREHYDRLDAVVNNAGGYFRTPWLTEHGVEYTFAVNHLAPFLLTNRLFPVVPADGRIVTVSSAVHRRADLDLDRIHSLEGYDALDAYARSKLANVLFAYELARRLDDVTANCLHPGFVPGSALWREAPPWFRVAVSAVARLPGGLVRRIADTPATAAATPVYLVASPSVAGVTGEYFVDCEPERSSPASYDRDAQRRLWERSVELAGMDSGDVPRT